MTFTQRSLEVTSKFRKVQPSSQKFPYKNQTGSRSPRKKLVKRPDKKRSNNSIQTVNSTGWIETTTATSINSASTPSSSSSASSTSSNEQYEKTIKVHFLRYKNETEPTFILFPDKNDVLKSGTISVNEKDNHVTVRAKVTVLLKELLPEYKGNFEFTVTFTDILQYLHNSTVPEDNLYARLTSPWPVANANANKKARKSNSTSPVPKKRKTSSYDLRVLTTTAKSDSMNPDSINNENMKGVAKETSQDKRYKSGSWQNPINNQDPMDILQSLIDKNLSCFIGVPALHNATKQIATMSYFNWLDNLPPQHPGHLVIVGNPGVGKTTGAWALANFMAEAGIVRSRAIVEAHRDDLVDRYVGGTEMKTNIIIHSAIGGVVIFDEVYTLNKPTSPNDAGKEALTTIMKYMTDENAPVFMFLGYKDNMKEFVNMNPGFQRRIRHTIDMKDYDAPMLANIVRFKIRDMKLQVQDGVDFEGYFRSLPNSYLQVRNASVAIQLIERAVGIARERTLALPHNQRKGASRTILKSDFDAAFSAIKEESHDGAGGNNEDLCAGIFI